MAVKGDQPVAPGIFIGYCVYKICYAGLSLFEQVVEKDAGFGLAGDVEFCSVAKVVQDVFRGLWSQRKAVDPGGLDDHLVDDVSVDMEGGRITEGPGDLVKFNIGPDTFLGFIKDAVCEFVWIFAQDAAVESQ